jgi:uncharacterized membrane protein YgcG
MRTLLKPLCETSVSVLLLGAPLAIAVEPGAALPVVSAGGEHGALVLEADTGKVLALNGAFSNIFVADPKVADVRSASASSLFMFGIAAGHTTVAAMVADPHDPLSGRGVIMRNSNAPALAVNHIWLDQPKPLSTAPGAGGASGGQSAGGASGGGGSGGASGSLGS